MEAAVSFFEDYLDMVEHNQMISKVEEVNQLTTEIREGIEAYHNAYVVVDYNAKYGIDQHFKDLIGDEALLADSMSVIKRFGMWLLDKIKKLISVIVQVVVSVWMVIKFIVTGGDRSDATIQCPYDLKEVREAFMKISVNLNHINLCANEDDINKLKERLIALGEAFRKATEPGEKKNTTRSDLHSHANTMDQEVRKVRSIIDSLVGGLEYMKSKLPSASKPEDFCNIIKEACNKSRIVTTGFTATPNIERQGVRTESEYTSDLRKYANGFLSTVTTLVTFLGRVGSITGSYIKELSKIYNNSKIQIHMVFPFDQGMIKRMSDYYGGPLKVRDMVITNTSPTGWPTPAFNDKRLAPMGWCFPSDGHHDSVDFWINFNYLFSRINRWLAALQNNARTSKEDFLLGVLVHECKHLWDMQHGLHFDDLNKVKYQDQDHEKRARESAGKFEITESDRAWARKIIGAIEAEYKKQQQAK